MPKDYQDSSAVKAYRNFGLPLMAVIEAIATKGASPGTAAMNQQQIFAQSDAQRRADAKAEMERLDKEAMAKRLEEETGYKREEAAAKKEERVGEQSRRQALRKQLMEAKDKEGKPLLAQLDRDILATDETGKSADEIWKKLSAMDLSGDGKAEKLEETKFQRTGKIKDDLRQDKTVTTFQQMQRYYDTMEKVWKPGQKTEGESMGPTDNALMKLYTLMLEPGLAVREDDVKLAVGGQANYDQFVGAMEKWKTGGSGFRNAYRDELVNTAKKIYGVAKDAYRESLKTHYDYAKKYGVDASDVFSAKQMEILSGLEKSDIDEDF